MLRIESLCALRPRLDSASQSVSADGEVCFISLPSHATSIDCIQETIVVEVYSLTIDGDEFRKSVPRFGDPSQSCMKCCQRIRVSTYIDTVRRKILGYLFGCKSYAGLRHQNLTAQLGKA